MNENKKNKVLGWSITTTILLLLFFGALQYCESSLLDLDTKWIIVSFIPIVLALIYTGVIKSFEGLGVKFETNLTGSITNFDIVGEVEALESPEMAKRTQSFLYQFDEQKRKKVERLKFTLLKRNYYDTGVISDYFFQLPNLKFIEVVDKSGKFKYLIRASHFKSRKRRDEADNIEDDNREKINDFIRSLERNSIQQSFSDVIDITIPIDSSLIDAYRIMQSTNQGRIPFDQNLPVINKNGVMIGFVSRRKIEENISRKVLEILDKK